MKRITINIIKFEQPAGDFYLGKLKAEEIIYISSANPRKYNTRMQDTEGGAQRELSKDRVRKIANYTKTVDASFPTSVILSLCNEDKNRNDSNYELNQEESELTFDFKENIADIVDGQHRIAGLKESGILQFDIPVVFILDSTLEQDAYLFATINGKQAQVSSSLISDLFGKIDIYSPYKVSHEIARALNKDQNSPFYKRLKMLGKKTNSDSQESLSQGSFVKELMNHISSNPEDDFDNAKRNAPFMPRSNCVFNEYFIDHNEDIIYKIILNIFSAVSTVWENEWNNPNDFVLSKTVGFTGIMKSLPALIINGRKNKDLTYSYFESIFKQAKSEILIKKEKLTSEYFGSSSSGANKLRDYIIKCIQS